VQLIIGKYVLPCLGSPSVWNTCLLLFQILLLLGYFYAHVVSARLPMRSQSVCTPVFVRITGNAGGDGTVVAFPDYAGSNLEAGCRRVVARVASDCCTGRERGIPFSDFIHRLDRCCRYGSVALNQISVSAYALSNVDLCWGS